ncbi:hypothetical protein SERLA73DRAFT_164231 [Serpula lacrymans var. lacrymans S7.3]|uniref:Uncharacterized protein n=1 Tax=Serpula lacrymans var. lacrymans (strain S7.3) TaxID=936435 RepID=F8QHZ7_SERL3|nr:hypothetical protein SERLA73DRAFT_164231 [Serpula lacrymans var. lacrymans S7.3]
MPEDPFQRSPFPNHSRIPINISTPQSSRSALSNAISLPQITLATHSRRPSGHSTPVHASPVSSTYTISNGSNTPASSIPSFRSLRNLLSFRPNLPANVEVASPNPSKHSFVTFGSIRRSMTGERKGSGTFPRVEDSEEYPVISIEANTKLDAMDREHGYLVKPGPDLAESHSPSRNSNSDDNYRQILPTPSPGPPLGTDLSTIIEAENSGISKYIPQLDESHVLESSRSCSPVSPSRRVLDGLHTPDSRDASALDLSTSKLTAEVMDALMVKDVGMATEWLNGVNGIVVEEATPIPTDLMAVDDNGHGGKEADATFNFDALDPDLAALLSPNRVQGRTAPFHSSIPAVPPRSHSVTPSRGDSPQKSASQMLDSFSSPEKSPRSSRDTFTYQHPSPLVSAQSSPARRSVSLSRGPSSRQSPSSLPRLMRSVTGAPAPPDVEPMEKPGADDSVRHISSAAVKRRHQPPSPLSSNGYSPVSSNKPYNLGESSARRPLQSRLATPSRHASSYTPATRPFRTPDAPSYPVLPEAGSVSPPSRAPSSLSAATDSRRPHYARPSLDMNGQTEVSKKRRAHLFFNRKRSMSVEETRLSPHSVSSYGAPHEVRPSSSLSNRPPTTEWLGPRTAKAFAAAGLLDPERDSREAQSGGGASRYASIRTSSERESRYTPSRMALSEAGSTSSWGRNGSISRTMTPSEAGMAWTGSPTFSSTPRTTFSGGSTAPTSISVSSSAQQATIQLMKEKHELETEALLSALSDSQRSSKMLREENTQLRERICVLEDRVGELLEQLHRPAPTPRPPPSFSRTVFDQTIVHPPHKVPQKPPLQRHFSHHSALPDTNTRLLPERQGPTGSMGASPNPFDPVPKSHRRRGSTTSSVFPNLPTNMSMLMLEDGVSERAGAFSCRSISPPSPTLALPKRSDSMRHTNSNQQSVSSSTGNISPTTASFCMTEMTGSPGSLHLRPEHELHLGDMASLDLRSMSDDGEGFDS